MNSKMEGLEQFMPWSDYLNDDFYHNLFRRTRTNVALMLIGLS
jgi:hypothetical protein